MKIAGAIALAALAISPVLAHHSFSTSTNRTKPVSVTGVVKKVEWKNPHIWFYVDVRMRGAGRHDLGIFRWTSGFLMRQGIREDAMKIGDMVKVDGFQARDGSNNASGGRVTFADGRSVFTASPKTSARLRMTM